MDNVIECCAHPDVLAASSGLVAHASAKPMDAACGGPRWVFVNTRPWPKLRAYVLHEGERKIGYELKGWAINSKSLPLELPQDKGMPPWSDNTLVEFVFYDNSHWQAVETAIP